MTIINLDHALASGQPANRLLFKRNWFGSYPDKKAKTWFEGGDAALFSVSQGDTTQVDLDGDGVITAGVDDIRYMEYFRVTRPLPAGVYRPTRKEVWATHLACNFVLSFDMTVTVTSPAGTVHEAFFDPVAIGAGVGADATKRRAEAHGFLRGRDLYQHHGPQVGERRSGPHPLAVRGPDGPDAGRHSPERRRFPRPAGVECDGGRDGWDVDLDPVGSALAER